MNIDKAIDLLDNLIGMVEDNQDNDYDAAFRMAINALRAQADFDTISRKAAIDIERNATVDTNPSHFVAHQKFTQFLDNAEISSFGRWQWSNGFNTALTAVGIDLKKLPSAQPEIIRCGECNYFKSSTSIYGECMCHDMWQSLYGDTPEVDAIVVHKDHYCGYAERRADDDGLD